MVSRAFQILSDPDKKAKYDKFGGDPDNRFGPGAASASSPFNGFTRTPSNGRGPMFEDEISPEELFNRFFGGGMGGAFGEFKSGYTIVSGAMLICFQVGICLEAAAHNLSSILAADRASEYTNSEEVDLGGDPVMPTVPPKDVNKILLP